MKAMLYSFISLLFLSCNIDADKDLSTLEIVEDVLSYEDSLYQSSKEKIHFEWIGEYNKKEKRKLRKWLISTTVSTQLVLGSYPFRMIYYCHRVQSDGAPVTFGYTKHGKRKDMHIFVDPTFSYEELAEHWVAPHEISHMAIPTIGRDNAWFAEGFATYMSRQIMLEIGVYTEDEIAEEYLRKILEFKDSYDRDEPFVEVVLDLRENHKYSHFYWGGAGYFYLIDNELRANHDLTLVSVLRKFQDCCRIKDKRLDAVVRSFDQISETTLFTDLLEEYRTLPAREIYEKFY